MQTSVYTQKSEPLTENEKKKIGGGEIQTNHLISARRPNLSQQQKKVIYRIVDLTIPAEHNVKLKQ